MTAPFAMGVQTRPSIADLKRRALVLWLAIASALVPACTKPGKPEPQLDGSRVITVEGSTLRYNGQVLSFDVPADDWQKILGPRSRHEEDISVWDDLGVFLYHASKGERRYGNPNCFTVLLGRKPHWEHTDTEPAFWPKNTFRGRLVVDGALIHKDSTINEIGHDKKGAAFQRAHLPTIFTYGEGNYSGWLELGYDQTLKAFSFSLNVTAR
jgi:hypothetical protein